MALSLANLWAHVRGFGTLRSALAPAHPLRALWAAYAALSVNAWTWSAVFHCRDTASTEALDYFSADALLAFALFAALARALRPRRPRLTALLGAALLAGWVQHVAYLTLVRFDYGYNTRLCVALGAAHTAVWLAWAFATRHPLRGRLAAVLAAAHAASLLELLDFPPLAGALDAHALWHAATPAATLAWYAFLTGDARHVTAADKPKA